MAKQAVKYEESIQEVEKIIEKIESGKISIDELTFEISKALELIAQCKKQLQTTENEIQKIINSVK